MKQTRDQVASKQWVWLTLLALLVTMAACSTPGAAAKPALDQPQASVAHGPVATNQEPSKPAAEMTERIKFAGGKTSAVLEGEIEAGKTREYVLHIPAGQMVLADVSSPDSVDGLTMSVEGKDGVVLAQMVPGLPGWRGRVPSGQDYLVRIAAQQSETRYSLTIILPQELEFESGSDSVTSSGVVVGGGIVHYLLPGVAGEKVNVSFSSPQDDVLLTVYGLEGAQPLVRHVSDAREWTGTWPADDLYMIHGVSIGETSEYTLTVSKMAELAGDLSAEALQNATYELEDLGQVDMLQGAWENRYGDGATMVDRAGLVQVALGDLDGDGSGDGAAVLWQQGGGSGTFISLAAMMNVDGAPEQATLTALGDRVQIEALRIEDGRVVLQVVKHGPDDPLCCPSLHATLVYELDGDQLVLVSDTSVEE